MHTNKIIAIGLVLLTTAMGCGAPEEDPAEAPSASGAAASGAEESPPLEDPATPAAEGDTELHQQPLILPAAIMACVGSQWYIANRAGGSDKYRHCVASCRSARFCGGPAAAGGAVGKEIFDWLCSRAPDPVKRAVNDISQCGGWDWADQQANARGISQAWKIWRSCEHWCR